MLELSFWFAALILCAGLSGAAWRDKDPILWNIFITVAIVAAFTMCCLKARTFSPTAVDIVFLSGGLIAISLRRWAASRIPVRRGSLQRK